MLFVYYITGHGFGHATRSLTVIDALLAARPETRVIVRSSVPAWFLQQSGPASIEVQPLDADTGIVQLDAITLDEEATAKRAAAFYRTFAARVADEAKVLRSLGPAAVIGDVPPLAFAAAQLAEVPSIAIANFTWDWIYEAYESFPAQAAGVIEQIGEAYALATLALRLPFPGGFATMQSVTRDIPLVARRSRLGKEEARRRLRLPSDRPVVLASFGGHPTTVPYELIAGRSRITLVVTDHELASPTPGSGVHQLTMRTLASQGIRYEDLVAAADIVVSKPGYGIVSECIANDTALLYTSRGRFAENDVMVEAMARFARTRFISQEALRGGTWQDAVEGLLTQPMPPERMPLGGAHIAAQAVLELATP